MASKYHKFSELRAKMSPERQQAIAEKTEKLAQQIGMADVRRARKLTQEDLAEVLQMGQDAVSKLERRADMYVSTLRKFIMAMGGYLEIRAVFPDREPIIITKFSENKKAAE